MKRWMIYVLPGLLLIFGVGLLINQQIDDRKNRPAASSEQPMIDIHASVNKGDSMKVVLSHEQRELRYLSPAFHVNTQKNIVYASKKNEAQNEEPLSLDVYEPISDSSKQRPVVIFIHGGGYKEGSKEDAADISTKLAERGYVVISMNYRLKTDPFRNFELTISDAYEDISDVIGWIQNHANMYGLDSNKIVIGGDSAGGYLAMNFVNDYLRSDPSFVTPILAVVDIYGGLLGNSVHENLPPVLIIHGTNDAMIPYRQSLDLKDALEQQGIYHDLFTMEGAGHDYKNAKYIDDVVETITHFLWNVMSGHVIQELPKSAGLTAASGDSVNIKLPESYTRNSGKGNLRINVPEGWELAENDAGGKVTLQVPAGLKPGNYTVFASVEPEDKAASVSGYVTPVKVLSPLKESFETYFDDTDQKVKTLMSIANQSKQPFNGSLQVTYETKQGPQIFTTDINQLEPGTSSEITIPELINGKRTVKGYDASGKLLHSSEDIFHALQIDKPQRHIQMDGDLKEWSHPTRFEVEDVKMKDWSGPDDARATGLLGWDSYNLYIALEVTDDQHVQPSSGSEIWSGDGVQFAIAIADENGSNPSEYHEMGIAMDDKGRVSKWRWITPEGFNIADFFETELAITRKEQTTVYEAAIPWNELTLDTTLVKPGMKLKFSLLVNDNDGEGRKGWLEFNSGIGTAKDINAFGDIYLTD